MSEYLTTNNIAIYGAVVATISIVFNALQYLLNLKDKKIKLEIFCTKAPDYEKELDRVRLLKPYEGGLTNVQFYSITVKNVGNVKTFIEDAYVLSTENKKYHVNVHTSSGVAINFHTIPEHQEDICIEPKSSKTFYVYLDKDENAFTVKSCCVLTKTGKSFTCVKPRI